MKCKFLGVILIAIFAITGTSCKSGKSCKGGGWYGNRNLGYEASPNEKQPFKTKETESVLSSETCHSANP